MNQQRRHHRRRFVAALLVAGVVGGTLATGSVEAQQEGAFVAEYADATFERRGDVLHLAPGEVEDQGTVSDVLEVSVTDESCQGRFLVAVNLAAAIEGPELEGVEVDARGGSASVEGTFSLSGDLTLTPAGRGPRRARRGVGSDDAPDDGRLDQRPVEQRPLVAARRVLRRRLRRQRRLLLPRASQGVLGVGLPG